MRGGRQFETIATPSSLERGIRVAQAQLERARALESWWPEAFDRGPVDVHVECVSGVYTVFATRVDGVQHSEPLIYTSRLIWEHAAETCIARERNGNGVSPLNVLVEGLRLQAEAEA